jgi:hypothetical protein
MLVIHGYYRFGKKCVGVKKDYCNKCKGESVVSQMRTLDVLHIYFIPLIPIGFVKRWECSLCGKDPRVWYKVRSGIMTFFYAVVALMLAVFTVGLWFGPPDISVSALYCLRLGLPAALVALIYFAFIRQLSRVDPEQARRLAVTPLDRASCIMCSTPLPQNEQHPRCLTCGVRTYTDALAG